jgi:hypothetical protein
MGHAVGLVVSLVSLEQKCTPKADDFIIVFIK